MSLISFTSFSQSENNQELLGLPGDNLDLYAVLDLFLKSKTIEGFEKSLNDEKTGINNLDLNNDEKVDFIKVKTEKDGDDFVFILQNPINEKETQDVAVIYVSKDKEEKVNVQIVGDESLYGKDYIVEPSTKPTPSVTGNPAYTGDNPVTVDVPASNTVVVVEAAPIVHYVYSPAYIPYYPPYYYGYYPPYYRAVRVTAVAIYRNNHYGYHSGGYHNTVVINNHNQYNNYNKSRPSTSQRMSTSERPSTSQRTSTSERPSTSQRTSTSQTNRSSSGNKASQRPSSSNYSSGSRSRASSSYSRPSYSSMGSMSRGGGGRRR